MFTEQEQQLLDSITRDFSKRAKHAHLQSFEEFMGKLYKFLGRVENGYEMTIDDYTNDLGRRDLAEELIAKVPSNLKKKISESLKVWDERYDKATNPTEKSILKENGSWWWYRLPKILIDELKRDVVSLDIK